MTPSEAIRVAPPVAASGATVVDAARIPAAEIPVDTPVRASTDTVKSVR